MVQRYKFESKSQQKVRPPRATCGCFQWFKGTNLKANHNARTIFLLSFLVVSNGSKVQIWKQITTPMQQKLQAASLFPMVQRYKFESKSQLASQKVVDWFGCFQWFKGTNLKANHNNSENENFIKMLFPMVQRYKFESKSQLDVLKGVGSFCCFQWFKGTNLKANHNVLIIVQQFLSLFPMVQRYKFESKSQHSR